MATGSFTADAVVGPRSFTADAWILRLRPQHHRVRDHYGPESDLFVVLDSDVGPYKGGTPLHFVIEDILERLLSLETATKVRSSVTAEAWLALTGTYGRGVLYADAVIFKADTSGSLVSDAWLSGGGSITADAWIQAGFTADAYLV